MDISPDGRFFIHRFPDHDRVDPHLFVPTLTRALEEIRDTLIDHVNKRPEGTHDERGLYTGVSGILFALHGFDFKMWESPLRHHKISMSQPPTILGGDLLIAIMREEWDTVRKLQRVAASLPQSECEVLNGRAGCLSGLLLARRPYPGSSFDSEIYDLARHLIEVGTKESDILRYEWHNKEYLGAVHGVAGILYVLLQVPPHILEKIDANYILRFSRTAKEVLSKYTLPSGNIKSSATSHSDHLVHFCHGATGWIPLLCLMSERIPGERDFYLEKARCLGEVVWERGLLATKGPGICHGIPGSICGLVDLYRVTRNERWINRAESYAIFLAREWKNLAPKADRPFSLFEGISGAYYSLSLVISERSRPTQSFTTSFPCFI